MKEIGQDSFSYAGNGDIGPTIEEIIIHSSVKTIGTDAFLNYTSDSGYKGKVVLHLAAEELDTKFNLNIIGLGGAG